jgi:hypothetical protein
MYSQLAFQSSNLLQAISADNTHLSAAVTLDNVAWDGLIDFFQLGINTDMVSFIQNKRWHQSCSQMCLSNHLKAQFNNTVFIGDMVAVNTIY